MRTRVLITLIVGLVGVAMLVMPSIGGADPDLNNVSAHRHFLVVAGSNPLIYLGEIGPDLCDNPDLQNAFNQFHNNLHRAEAGSIGGPAAGLHDTQGADLVSRGCTFVPPS
jgi:hypothetical protein